MVNGLQLTVLSCDELSRDQRLAIMDLVNRAYEEDLTALFHTFAEATHVLGTVGETLVSHALWVTRWLQVDGLSMLRTAYVELVATDAAWRRRGYATAVMRRVAQEVQGYDIAALSPFSVAYYARLGWERWQGPLLIRKDGKLLPTDADEDVMILRLPQTPPLDLRASLSVEWREGEVW
ncbi:MAG: GNAT family N-acetyltransferase [Anaerolineae bacterium]|jgi:aminoglycoside 2'-N-acetyltransferase I|nr:GNAT family N-acetyltransferase [Anaerolineae bacterium]